MPRPIICMTWGTSLAWQMSGCFGSQIKTLRGALLPNFSSQASQIRLVLLLCLSTWAKTKSQSSVLGKPEISTQWVVSCFISKLMLIQGLEAGTCRMHWEEWILTCKSTIDLIVLGVTSLFVGPNLWFEYHNPCRKYFQPPDSSIRWHLRRRNFPPCSKSMSVAMISTKSCHC